jgi:hypothetical protein
LKSLPPHPPATKLAQGSALFSSQETKNKNKINIGEEEWK